MVAGRRVTWFMWQMTSWYETFSTLLAPCEGNSQFTGGFPLQRARHSELFLSWPEKNVEQINGRTCHVTVICMQTHWSCHSVNVAYTGLTQDSINTTKNDDVIKWLYLHTGYIQNFIVIFDMCRINLTVVTPVKHQRDSLVIKSIFVK